MHIIDQSEQRTIAGVQCVFWGALSLITFKKSEGINQRLQKAQAAFKEASDRNKI